MERPEKKELYEKCRNIAVFMLVLFSLIVLLWPYLWANPISRLIDAVIVSGRINFNTLNLYLGDVLEANEMPWHYNLVWIAITTPLVYSLLFIFGFANQVTRPIREIKSARLRTV